MNQNINLKTLEQSALNAHQRMEPAARDFLFDPYFITQHLVPVLQFRMQAHIPFTPAEMAQLWAEHVGLSQELQGRWLPNLESTFAQYAQLLSSELQLRPIRVSNLFANPAA